MSEVENRRLKDIKAVGVLKPQGKDKLICRVHENVEYTVGGIVIPNTERNQDFPRTGDVVSIGKVWSKDKDTGEEIYPDIKEGVCVLTVINGWSSTFVVDGVMYAIASAANVIAAYDPKDLV